MTADQLKMLNELLNDDSDRLSAWEVEFIESLDGKRGNDISEKQEAVLNRVWDKVFL